MEEVTQRTNRTAVYGSVRTVWQGSVGDRRPYADQSWSCWAQHNQDYIQLWHGDANLLRESLEAVQQTSSVILGGIAPEPAALAAAA